MVEITLSEIAEQLKNCRLRGRDCSIKGLTAAGEPRVGHAEVCWQQGLVVKSPAIVEAQSAPEELEDCLLVENLQEQFPQLLEIFRPSLDYRGVSAQAVVAGDFSYQDPVHVGAGAFIGPEVSCGPSVYIGPGVVIYGQVTLAEGVVLHSGVKIQSPATLGCHTVIHSNTVLGADGFGYQFQSGKHRKLVHLGGVKIGDRVEIGASTTVDRATLGETVVGSGTKIDDQVHIGHNCKIGENCLIIGQAGLAGTVTLGDYVTVSGQTAIKDHVKIADNVQIAGKSGVTKDITREGAVVSGFPAQLHRDELKQKLLIKKLPEIYQKLRDLNANLESS